MTDNPLTLVDPEFDESAKLRAHRDLVRRIEDEIAKHEPLPIEVRHYFAHGVYAREVFLPKGTTASGKIHKFSQVNIISQGDIAVLTPDGEIRYRAPTTFVSPPGTKRAVHAHEDTVWTTIIGTDETDPAKAEAELVVNTEEDYARHLELTRGPVLEIT